MRTARTVAELRSLLAPERRAGHSIGLVPMGGRLYAIGGGQYALSVSSANEFLSLR